MLHFSVQYSLHQTTMEVNKSQTLKKGKSVAVVKLGLWY